MTIGQAAHNNLDADGHFAGRDSRQRQETIMSTPSERRRSGAGSGPIRWAEFVAVASILGGGLVLIASPATWIPTSTLLGAITAVCTLSVPLAPGADGVVKTAMARRSTEATVLAMGASLVPMALTGATVPVIGLAAIAGSVWVSLSLILAVRPLPVSELPKAGLAEGPRADRLSAPVERAAKRCIDIVGASFILAITSPLLLVTAFAIRRDGGPALFRQERIGGGGQSTFQMLKFRSMVIDAEAKKSELAAENERTGPIFKLSNDPRITSVGKIIRDLSVDELPQLINILRGEMSLVGPRPALLDEAAEFDKGFLAHRSTVKPGLTGLWQAEARNDPDFGRYESLDRRYVDEWTLGLDIRILMATVVEVLTSVLSKPLKAMGFKVAAGDAIIDLRDSATVIELREDPARA